MIEMTYTELLLFAAWGLTVAYASWQSSKVSFFRKRAYMAETLLRAIMEDDDVRASVVRSYKETFGEAK